MQIDETTIHFEPFNMETSTKDKIREALKKELLTFCKYYSPKSYEDWESEKDTYAFWLSERIWIDAFVSGEYSFIEDCIAEYIKYEDHMQTDDSKVPLSLRAILFDYFQHNSYAVIRALGKDFLSEVSFEEFFTKYNR